MAAAILEAQGLPLLCDVLTKFPLGGWGAGWVGDTCCILCRPRIPSLVHYLIIVYRPKKTLPVVGFYFYHTFCRLLLELRCYCIMFD